MMRRCVIALFAMSLLSLATERILFLHIGPKEANLFISNADGAGERPLGGGAGRNYNPAWSPKGDWIAFTSDRNGSADLYRIHPDGQGLERLTDDPAFDDQAAFSADGQKIVFVSTREGGRANLWILDLATRQAKPLTSGRGGDFRPSWSPDGKWIAFSSDRESNLPAGKGRWERLHLVDIYVIRPDGAGLKRISEHGNFCGSPKWTADSQSIIAYCMGAEETLSYRVNSKQGDSELVRIGIANGGVIHVQAGAGIKMFPSVLPSNEIGFLRHDSPAGVFYSSGKKGPAGSNVHTPSWSPDGASVVYSRFVTGRVPEPAPMWSRNPKYELFTTGFLPAYSPDGERFATTMFGDKNTKLWIVETGQPARSLLERKELMLAPQWSPDGKRIIFGIGAFSAFADFDFGAKKPVERANGGAQIGIVNADGTGFELISSGPNNNAFPSYSPDGKRIVYRTAGPEGDGLRIMNVADRSVTKLSSEWDNFPVWSPGGNLIAFMRMVGGDFEVCTIRPDGTGFKQLTDTHGNDAHVAWSPDGEHIVFTSSRLGFKDEALLTGGPQPYGEIFVMRSDGTQIEQLTDNQWEDGGPAWQPHKSAR